MEYMKSLNIGEVWANYSFSYINVHLGDMHKNEFTLWPTNYLQKPSSQEDIEISEENLEGAYTTKNLYKGMIKYYA